MRSQESFSLQMFMKQHRGGLAVTLLCLCSLITMSLLNLTAEETLSMNIKELANFQPLQYNRTDIVELFSVLPTIHAAGSNESINCGN